jgi:hypothetical protein
MVRRHQLQELLESLLESKNVYFQPPNNLQLDFPAIIYERDYSKTEFADNSPYSNRQRYSLIVVDRDADSLLPAKIAALPLCSFERHFVADNLHHDRYNIYF